MLSLRFYGMQLTTKPLDNKKVRQAINFAINREQIDQEAFQGMDSIQTGSFHWECPVPLLRKFFIHTTQNGKSNCLAEAGYPEGKGLPPLEFWSASKAEMTQRELDLVSLQSCKDRD